MNPLNVYVFTSAALIVIGLYGIAVKRNMIKTVISIEIITAGVNLNFLALTVGTSFFTLAQYFVIVSIALGAAVASIALSMVIQAYRHYGSIDLRKLSRLRW
ncbi:MAG: NADH-quinone oxidoreductase subunit K [Candidatus Nezhaarchaeales archaeon]